MIYIFSQSLNLSLQSIFFSACWKSRQKAWRNIATNEIKLFPSGTCLIMTRKRYPWEKGWQYADLSARLLCICLEPALSPHVGRAAVRHTQVTYGEAFFYEVLLERDPDTPSPWLSHLQTHEATRSNRCSYSAHQYSKQNNIASHYTAVHMHIVDVNIFTTCYIKKYFYFNFSIYFYFFYYLFFYAWNIFLHAEMI